MSSLVWHWVHVRTSIINWIIIHIVHYLICKFFLLFQLLISTSTSISNYNELFNHKFLHQLCEYLNGVIWIVRIEILVEGKISLNPLTPTSCWRHMPPLDPRHPCQVGRGSSSSRRRKRQARRWPTPRQRPPRSPAEAWQSHCSTGAVFNGESTIQSSKSIFKLFQYASTLSQGCKD